MAAIPSGYKFHVTATVAALPGYRRPGPWTDALVETVYLSGVDLAVEQNRRDVLAVLGPHLPCGAVKLNVGEPSGRRSLAEIDLAGVTDADEELEDLICDAIVAAVERHSGLDLSGAPPKQPAKPKSKPRSKGKR